MTWTWNGRALLFFLLSLGICYAVPIPEQIHLSITSDPTQMVVQWITWSGKFAGLFQNSNCNTLNPQLPLPL